MTGTLMLNVAQSNALTSSDCMVPAPFPTSPYDDWLAPAPAGGLLVADVEGDSTWIPSLDLFDAGGNTLLVGGTVNLLGTHSQLRFAGTASGQRRVRVSSILTTGGPYTIREMVCTGASISATAADSVRDSLVATPCTERGEFTNDSSYANAYVITGAAGKPRTITVVADSGTFNPNLEVTPLSVLLMASVGGAAAGDSLSVTFTPSWNGDFFVIVGAETWGATGGYKLVVR